MKTDKTDIIISGARITNPESERAREFAKMYYEEIRNFSTDTKKKENPNMEHWEAHEQASRKYNYTKEVVEYYGNLKKYKKEK